MTDYTVSYDVGNSHIHVNASYCQGKVNIIKVRGDKTDYDPFPLMMWEETIAYKILDHLNSPEYKLSLDRFFENNHDEYQNGEKQQIFHVSFYTGTNR